jgi:hypothetical protein
MPSPVKKRKYIYIAVIGVVLLLMFVFPIPQSFLSINGHEVNKELQLECNQVFYNYSEEGWISTQGYVSYDFTVGSGNNLWCEFEYSISFTPPENETNYAFWDWPWGGGCTGDATIIVTNAGEEILHIVDAGEVSTFGSGVNITASLGSWIIEIINNFSCDIYFRFHITVYGCSNTGVGGPTGPKGP